METFNVPFAYQNRGPSRDHLVGNSYEMQNLQLVPRLLLCQPKVCEWLV